MNLYFYLINLFLIFSKKSAIEKALQSTSVETSYSGIVLPEDLKIDHEWVLGVMEDMKNNKFLHKKYLVQIIGKIKDYYSLKPSLVDVEIPDEDEFNVCGDIHGQYYDLLRLFEYGGFPPDANYLFLGDYIDRGKQSLETVCLLLAYKIKYPENFFLLRGNHECASINRIYGFYDECKRRHGIKLWKIFTDCFNCLPIAALVDEKILCMHGGLSPELNKILTINNIVRPTDVPDTGLLCDLLWSDPDKEVTDWGDNDRGVSFTFGEDIVRKFNNKNEIDLICRAH